MPATKISIYLHDRVREALHIDNADSLTAAVNSALARYAGIVERDCPAFSEAEWYAIVDALNGINLAATVGMEGDTVDLPCWIHAELHDAELGEKWGIDSPDLENRLQRLPYAQACAVVEVAIRFWRHPQLNELPTRDLLAVCGARFAD